MQYKHPPRDCQALEVVQKLALKFVKGLRHVLYKAAPFHSPYKTLFACSIISTFHATQFLLPPPTLGLAVMLSKFTNSGVKPVAVNTLSALKLAQEIVSAITVETFKLRLDPRW